MAVKWGEITLGEVVSAIGGRQVSGSPNIRLKGLSTDSRTMAPGYLFVALKGETYDGHDFLANAINAGAIGVIVESRAEGNIDISGKDLAVVTVQSTLTALGDLAMWWRKQWQGRVIGVTGSNGKTTTKEMAASILSLEEHTMKSPGNFNNLIGLPLSILTLQEEHKIAVLEMGMNKPGEIARLTRIAGPDRGLITNITGAHLEGLRDLEGVRRAKGELLSEMSRNSTAILNGDDALTAGLAIVFKGPIITFGLDQGNQVRATHIRDIKQGLQAFTIHLNGDEVQVTIHLPGMHNVFNALGAAAIAYSLSLSGDVIARGLGRFRPLKGRFQIIHLKGGIRMIDDTYNSNPSSLKAALQTIKDLQRSGLIVGLGEMLELGKESAALHVSAGELVAHMGARYLVALGEHGHEIIIGACKAGMKPQQTCLATNHSGMIDEIRGNVREGDTIFLKGSRKMALDTVVESLKAHFGAHEEGKNAL